MFKMHIIIWFLNIWFLTKFNGLPIYLQNHLDVHLIKYNRNFMHYN